MNVGNKNGQNPTQPSKALVARGNRAPQAPPIPGTQITSTRCKVCNSPFRREIDMCLVTGWSQSSVMRHFNQVIGGEIDHFNKMNISRHAKYHLDAKDAAVRRIIEARAKQFIGDVDAIEGSILTKAAVLDTMIQRGIDGVHSGAVEIKGQDILSAVQLLDKMEAEWKDTAIDEILNEFKVFAAMVQEKLGEDEFREFFAAFEAKIDNKSRPVLMPAGADVKRDPDEIEGELVEDDEE